MTLNLPENKGEQRRALLAEIEAQEAALAKADAAYEAAETQSEPFRKRMRAATDKKWEAKKRLAQARSDLTELLADPAEPVEDGPA